MVSLIDYTNQDEVSLNFMIYKKPLFGNTEVRILYGGTDEEGT